jgi:sugar O-acyltransferase (sialic acid O-acetyltransferase NeuD family)
MMLNKLGLIGKGGFVKEVLASINKKAFIPTIVNDIDGSLQSYMKENQTAKYLLCMGNPDNRETIYCNNLNLNYLDYHISNGAHLLDKHTINISTGSIICTGSVLTCDIIIGKMTHINLNCTIGHDVTIGNFVTCSPGVNISGNCNIGNNVFIGSNSVIKQDLNIGNNIVIGMGSVVTKHLIEPGIYIGNPCKKV